MAQLQWFRRYQLITGSRGRGLTVDNLTDAGLRVTFEISKSLQKEPNQAKFQIYNLTPNHAALIQDEYTDVIFNAGYEGGVRLLFSGNTQFVANYADKTDWITELICGDGDQAFRNTFINHSFAAGSTDETVVDYCREQLPNVKKGPLQLNPSGSLRGRTYSKMAHETLDEIARTNGCNWSIQNGALQMVRADRMLNSNSATVLTAETGLLEAAERTSKGITAKCLLNPDISVNSAVKLDNSAIRARINRGRRQNAQDQTQGPIVNLNKDGIYKVFKVRHMGDTHSNDWFTEVLCVGLGQPMPTSTSNTAAAVPIGGQSG
jgi:hypothetical protein